MVVLGNTLADNLSWDIHVQKVLIPVLRNTVHTLRIVNKYLQKVFRAQYTNSVFHSKLMFGIEPWGGVLQKPSFQRNITE